MTKKEMEVKKMGGWAIFTRLLESIELINNWLLMYKHLKQKETKMKEQIKELFADYSNRGAEILEETIMGLSGNERTLAIRAYLRAESKMNLPYEIQHVWDFGKISKKTWIR